MNWNEEIINSLIWLVQAFLISGTGFVVFMAGMMRFTQIGRDFARLAGDYFSLKRSVKPLLLLTLLIILVLAAVKITALLFQLQNVYYSALQDGDSALFWRSMMAWPFVVCLIIARALTSYYFKNALLIDWREWLTHQLQSLWLSNQNYLRAHFASQTMDNPDQRIQEDIQSFCSLSYALTIGLLDACVSLFEFTLVLWALSGTLHVLGYEIPRAMVFLAYIYVFVNTLIAIWLGRPLIQLNFLNEKLNANYRYALIRLREYAEGVAFYKGEKVEQGILNGRFKKVIQNSWAVVFRTLKFDGFNASASYIAQIFPLLIQAPRLLAKEIKFGDVMQSMRAFGQVEDALSYFRTSYDSYASYRACTIRLLGYLAVIEETQALGRLEPQYEGQQFALRQLQLNSPQQQPLIQDLSLQLSPGQALLIQGPSGVGKTSLLRALAGLWPFAAGQVVLPEGASSLFLPQKPYLPLGTLAQALSYPEAEYDSHTLTQVLQQVQLGHLVGQLQQEVEWTQVLSLGEQQRLAIGRALLAKPSVLYLDESSSAMDEGLEFALYQLLKTQLPQCILISVGHRSSLLALHSHSLVLHGQGRWALNTL